MKIGLTFSSLSSLFSLLLLFVTCVLTANVAEEAVKDESEKIKGIIESKESQVAAEHQANLDALNEIPPEVLKELPPTLGLSNFDRVVRDGLHFVEFFSPYCGHCKQFAPIWEKFYNDFYEEGKKLNVHMHQVNCVEDADLCAREAIKAYPSLRLYAPNDSGTGGKLVSTFSSSFERTPEGLSEFLREAASDFNEDGEMDLDLLKPSGSSASSPPKIKFVDANELLNIISGKISKPILLSFWSSSDENLDEKSFLTDPISNKFYSDCSRCFDFRNIWLKANKMLSSIQRSGDLDLGIVNCKSNSKICTSLGMHDLVNNYDKGNFDPKVFMFLPSDEGGNKIRFKSSVVTAKRIASWTKRLLDIYKLEDISFRELKNKKRIPTRIPKNKDQVADPPQEPAITFVYYYDEATHVKEDFQILHHLIQPIMDSMFNVYLYKSSDPAVLEHVKTQEASTIEFINDGFKNIPNEKEDDGSASTGVLDADEEMFAARTLTTFPMLICFKDGSYSSTIFQTYGSGNIRDYNQIIQFIKKNSLPYFFELTDYNKREVFPASMRDSIHDKSEKVLITLYDGDEIAKSFPNFYFMSYIQHSYQYMKNLYQFSKLKLKRDQKHAIVQNLKEKNADTGDIIKALRKVIPSVFNQEGNLVSVYLDINRLQYYKKFFNWDNLNVDDYKSGDVLVVSRFKNEIWELPTIKQDGDSSESTSTQLQVSNTRDIRDLIFESAFKVVPPVFPPITSQENEDTSGEDTSINLRLMKSKLKPKKMKNSSFNPFTVFANIKLSMYIIICLFVLLAILVYKKMKYTLNMKRDRLKGLGILGRSNQGSFGGMFGKFD